MSGFHKVDEVPYDFVRKRLSILVARDGEHLLITKGALCTACSTSARASRPAMELSHATSELRASLLERLDQYGREGFRVLGVAVREMDSCPTITREDERDMTFLGFLLFFDPPKKWRVRTLARLRQLGVVLKIITGDSALVAQSISRQVGMENPRILRGPELDKLSDEALRSRAGT